MNTATLTVDVPMVDAVIAAIKPESLEEFCRTHIRMHAENGKLCITIKAEDTTSLRAALNSYIRWIQVAVNTVNLTKMKGG